MGGRGDGGRVRGGAVGILSGKESSLGKERRKVSGREGHRLP